MYSDRVSAMTGGDPLPQMIPFRGEYLLLKRERSHLVRGNIYPVPNPNFPFLGVHFTPRMNGDIWLGPNAVLGFSREGYGYSDVSLPDLIEIVTFEGMIRIVMKHGVFGMTEMYKSLVLSAQVKELQKYVPQLKLEDVTRGPSGVRAQAVNRDGSLVEDFIFDETQANILHVRNAPSPGATSSLAIGRLVVDRAEVLFGFSSNNDNDN
jgi:2-hydroxyglutarate dehydrogenase